MPRPTRRKTQKDEDEDVAPTEPVDDTHTEENDDDVHDELLADGEDDDDVAEGDEDDFGDEDEDGFGDEDEEDGEEEELPELMVHTRQRRANAGNRMRHLLERKVPQDAAAEMDLSDEEPDEFWDTMKDYFAEGADDSDFTSEESEFDEVDSDFDLPEDLDAQIESLEQEAEEEEREMSRQSRRAAAAATQAILGKRTKRATEEELEDEEPAAAAKSIPSKRVKQAGAVGATPSAAVQLSAEGGTAAVPVARRASSRSIAREQAEATQQLLAEQARQKDKTRPRNVTQIRILTQEEQLAEAKRTEILNKKSLEDLLRVEEHAKRLVARKPTPFVPSILSISWNKNARLPSRFVGGRRSATAATTTSTNLSPAPLTSGADVRSLGYAYATTPEAQTTVYTGMPPEGETVSQLAFRMTIPFSYVAPLAPPTYPVPYSSASSKQASKQTCVITGAPARYRCPYTKLPYANLDALKELRVRVESGRLDPNVVVPEAAEATRQPPHPHLNGLQPSGTPIFLAVQDAVTTGVLSGAGENASTAGLTTSDISPDPKKLVAELSTKEERILAQHMAQNERLTEYLQLSAAVTASRLPNLIPVYATQDTIGPTAETRTVCAQLVERSAATGVILPIGAIEGQPAAGTRQGHGTPRGSGRGGARGRKVSRPADTSTAEAEMVDTKKQGTVKSRGGAAAGSRASVATTPGRNGRSAAATAAASPSDEEGGDTMTIDDGSTGATSSRATPARGGAKSTRGARKSSTAK